MSWRPILAVFLASLLVGAIVASIFAATVGDPRVPSVLPHFSNRAELADFIHRSRTSAWPGPVLFGDVVTATGGVELSLGRGQPDYSQTNVQVEGVDEADLVKTDGEFLYIVYEEGIAVVRAYPVEEMGLAYTISREEIADSEQTFVVGLYLVSDRLIVISIQGGAFWAFAEMDVARPSFTSDQPETTVTVFEVGSGAPASRTHTVTLSGSYVASRMTSGHVYIITQEFVGDPEALAMPVTCVDASCEELPPWNVFYDEDTEGASSFVNVAALDPASGDVSRVALVAGYASTIYMSTDNLYITFPKAEGEAYVKTPFGWGLTETRPVTSIYRIGIQGLSLWVAAEGTVLGSLLDQFSMDEAEGHLRVVTTVWKGVSVNNVYILDAELDLVGGLVGLAPGETVYSSRFVDTTLYLVTFQKVDPFFVIDLADPAIPRVLGYLKIPGFSEYLHPMGDDLVLGVGKDAVAADEGNFAWFQGLKLSLFDVADVEHPTELAKVDIGDRGTTSQVLSDHRAFLPIPQRGWIALPVTLAEINESHYPDGVPPWAHGEPIWQGVYVFSVSREGGFGLRGTVSHAPDPTALDGYWWSPQTIVRALYIGETLYTISRTAVQANALDDLAEVGHVVFEAG